MRKSTVIHSPLRSFARCASVALLAAAAQAATAAPIVVGTHDPATHTTYDLKNVYISSFADGTPITKFRLGYSQVSKAYFFSRGGWSPTRGCRTEVFRLVPISGNRLAIADPTDQNMAWGVKPIPTKMYASFDCISTFCMDCLSSDDALGANTDLENPHCVCNPNLGVGGQGECTTTKPGLGGPYGPGAIVFQPI